MGLPRPLPSDDDLRFAIEWLGEGYESDDPNDSNLLAAHRVANWLRRVMTKQQEDRAVELISRHSKVSRRFVRQKVRKIMATREN